MRIISSTGIARQTTTLTALLLFFAGIATVRADTMQQLASRAGLPDTIFWNQLGGGHIANGATVVSPGGVSATVSGAATGLFVGQQSINWFGDFGFADYILDTGDNISSTYGPMTITFATPIAALGTQIEVDAFVPYSGTISAYDTASNLLATYPFSGTAHGNGDNSAAFIGLADLSGPHIASVIIHDNATTGSAANFAINQLSVPEPAGLSAGLMGGSSLLMLRRRRPA
jgi:hypothetical protein